MQMFCTWSLFEVFHKKILDHPHLINGEMEEKDISRTLRYAYIHVSISPWRGFLSIKP